MIDERVARNAGLLVVGLRESAVDNHQFSVRLNRVLAIAYVYRHMSVDDMSVLAYNIESVHYIVNDLFVIA